ncbi:MAG: DEAD/DEAH box helicase family protein [Bacteroidia bacterium]|nr:DEAD/DEAH box helicase family protein [Bacteroidia bacterium]
MIIEGRISDWKLREAKPLDFSLEELERRRSTNLYRNARERAFHSRMAELNSHKPDETDKEKYQHWSRELAQLRWGFWPEGIEHEYKWVDFFELPEIDSKVIYRWIYEGFDEPAQGFEQLTRLNNYFLQNPSRVLGTEAATTSREFPVTVKGSRESVTNFFKELNSKNKPKITEMDLLKLKAKATATKLRLMNLNQDERGFNGLGALGNILGQVDPGKLSQALKKSKQGIKGAHEKLTFDQVDELYNQGITTSEKQAWVWYKRSLGLPMTGWNKYYLHGDAKAEYVVTTRSTTIRKGFNASDLLTVPAGENLGKFTGRIRKQAHLNLVEFRKTDGTYFVNQEAVELKKGKVGIADADDLNRLVREGALFYSGGELLPYAVFAFGNMYDRELELRKDKSEILTRFGEEVYQKHLQAIADAKPRVLSILNPDKREHPKILAISDFAREFTISKFADTVPAPLDISTAVQDDSDPYEDPDLQRLHQEFAQAADRQADQLIPRIALHQTGGVSLFEAFKQWLNQLPATDFKDSSAYNIENYYLRGGKITDEPDKAKRDQIRSNARNEGEELFSRFLTEALEFRDKQRLDLHWNRVYNGQASIQHHRVPVGFEISARFKEFNLELRPAQREGIAFMNAMGSGIIAYEVGVGKTMTAIAALADALFSGKAQRPLVIVPNAVYNNWIQELAGHWVKTGKGKNDRKFIPGILSNTGIKINEWYNLGNQILKRIKLKKTVEPKSITIVTYEGFKKIGFGASVEKEMVEELSNALGQAENATARQEQINYNDYWEKIGVGQKGTVAEIDTLGIDYIVMDEAHMAKNIFDGVKAAQRDEDELKAKRFGIQGQISETGLKAFFLCNYIQRKYGRNVCLLTATPFTNSPLEIYSILSLVAYNQLKEMNILGLRQFFELFVLEENEFVVDVKGQLTSKSVIKRFNNRLVLQKLIFNHIIHKTGEEAGVVRPCKVSIPRINATNEEGKLVRLNPKDQVLSFLSGTPAQVQNQKEIVSDMQRALSGKLQKGLLFQAMASSQDNALSPFLYKNGGEPVDAFDFVSSSPKINYVCECIRTVKKWHEARGQEISGQVIYMNRGKRFFNHIKEYLTSEIGFRENVSYGRSKVDEVEIITGQISQIRREIIQAAFNEGVVKVIIGTSTIRTGVNLQRRSTVLYNCYPDWNPTDLRQLEGRIWRQGNKFGFVRIVMPLVENTMDVFVFQKLEEKTARINDIWYRGDRGNVLDLESLDPEEIKFALMTDLEAIARMEVEKHEKIAARKVERLESDYSLVSQLKTVQTSYEYARPRLLDSLSNYWNSQFEGKPEIENPSKEEVESWTDWKIKSQRLHRQVYLKLKRLLKENLEVLDADIINAANSLNAYYQTTYNQSHFTQNRLIGFIESVKVIRQAEGGILTRLNLKPDQIGEALSRLSRELELAKEEAKRVNETDFFQSILKEIKEKKRKLAITGEDVMQRVKEFESLNHLLGVLQGGTANCLLPDPNSPLPEPAKSLDNLALLRLKAKAVAVKLRLLDLKIAS